MQIPASAPASRAIATAGAPLPTAPAAPVPAPPSVGFKHAGTVSFVSSDGRYGFIDSPDFRSVFVWQTALESPAELRIGQRIAFDAGGVGWDPNRVEAVRGQLLDA